MDHFEEWCATRNSIEMWIQASPFAAEVPAQLTLALGNGFRCLAGQNVPMLGNMLALQKDKANLQPF